MYLLWKDFLTKILTWYTIENTHRREAIPMQALWAGFLSEQQNEERYHINVAIVKRNSHKKTFSDTLKDPHWGEAIPVQTL